jgi:hypothetical protein
MIRTHTFSGKKYQINFADSIEGVCDSPKRDDSKAMTILTGSNLRALNSALHEAMEADGFCDKCLHDSGGFTRTENIGRFLWRLGYRLKK